MKIIFMGTPDFAVESLRALLDSGFEIPLVITAPDKPSGRGQQLNQSAVKKFALERNLKVAQPANLKDTEFLAGLSQYQADAQVVVAFRMLPEAVWNMPPLGTYNLHASLLPAYRGAAPINRAIMNGEKETGVTVFRLTHEIDSGSILKQERIPVGEKMNAGELHDELMMKGAALLVNSMKLLADSTNSGKPVQFVEQDNTKVSLAPKIFRKDCMIRWNAPVNDVYNQIRGLSPYPGAFTLIEDHVKKRYQMKIFSCEKQTTQAGEPGKIDTDDKTDLCIECADGKIRIIELQLEGKKRMYTRDFLRGFRMSGSMIVESPDNDL